MSTIVETTKDFNRQYLMRQGETKLVILNPLDSIDPRIPDGLRLSATEYDQILGPILNFGENVLFPTLLDYFIAQALPNIDEPVSEVSPTGFIGTYALKHKKTKQVEFIHNSHIKYTTLAINNKDLDYIPGVHFSEAPRAQTTITQTTYIPTTGQKISLPDTNTIYIGHSSLATKILDIALPQYQRTLIKKRQFEFQLISDKKEEIIENLIPYGLMEANNKIYHDLVLSKYTRT